MKFEQQIHISNILIVSESGEALELVAPVLLQLKTAVSKLEKSFQ